MIQPVFRLYAKLNTRMNLRGLDVEVLLCYLPSSPLSDFSSFMMCIRSSKIAAVPLEIAGKQINGQMDLAPRML